MHTGSSNSWIQRYIGIPYEIHGHSAKGVDCWGLVHYVYKQELGILLPDFKGEYSDQTDKESITGLYMDERMHWHKVQNPEPLDCVMFNIFGRPVHIGVIVDEEYFIHAPESSTTRLERYADRVWTRRIEGFYRHERSDRNR